MGAFPLPNWVTVVSEEAKALLLEGDNLQKAMMERNWINLFDYGEAWGM